MEQGTVILVILLIVIFAFAALSFPGLAGNNSPSATPPNPKAEFGVIHEQKSFFGSTPPTPSPTNETPPPTPQSNLELQKKYISLSKRNTDQRDISQEYVQISYSSSANESLDLTDWAISNSRGESFKLGNTTQLPGSGPVGNQDRLIVPKGSSVYIITGQSPRGESFRANKCVDYLNQFKKFTPSLPGSCPSPKNEQGQETLNDACYLYVQRLSSCQMPSTPYPLNLDNTCIEYVLKIASYDACVRLHKNDPDFYKNEYWTYLNRPNEIWSQVRDSIILRNSRGEVVTTISYQ